MYQAISVTHEPGCTLFPTLRYDLKHGKTLIPLLQSANGPAACPELCRSVELKVMRLNNKLVLALSLLIVALGVAVSACLSYPRSWMEIRAGDTQHEVRERTQGAEIAGYDMLGDFFHVNKGPVRWELQVEYDAQNRVKSAEMIMLIRAGQRSWKRGVPVHFTNIVRPHNNG